MIIKQSVYVHNATGARNIGRGNIMKNLKVTQCKGEGLGSCKRCSDNGIWNRNWMCFLYKIEGMKGCYCSKCVKELMGE